MAQPYLDELRTLVARHAGDSPDLACRHFFAGAALYVAGAICATFTPVGLAFKLPSDQCARLIDTGRAAPLRYFARAPVKRGYALFTTPDRLSGRELADLFQTAVAHVLAGTT